MTANSDPSDPAQPHGSDRLVGKPSGDPEDAGRPGLGRNIRLTALFLIISALVFCMIVVRQRDATRKGLSLEWAAEIQNQLQGILDERKFLPRALPDDSDVDPKSHRIPYPSPDEIGRLEIQDQPFALIAGPLQGMIQPGGDGCAVVLFDSGQVSTGWMTFAEVKTALQRRTKLAAGPATSD